MAKIYLPLPALTLKIASSYSHPVEPPEVTHWDDPALGAMIDFKYLKAATIGPGESIETALVGVKNSIYHMLIVENKEQQILGIISAEDLLGEKPLKAIQELRLARSDIEVRVVMTPQAEILALDLEALRHAKVGHIVETLRAHKQHYALIVKIDEHDNSQIVRGVFSASLLSKQLGEDVLSSSPEMFSIAELQHDLHLND